MRAAVIDLGSCTFHALVADVDAHGVRRAVFDHKVALRLGDHVYTAGTIPEAAFATAVDTIGALVTYTRHRQAEHLRMIATAAFREAANGRELLDVVEDRFDIAVDVIDGALESRLTWTGVSTELAGSHGVLATIELGGGSLQLGVGACEVDTAESVPLGVSRARGLTSAEIRDRVRALVTPGAAEIRSRQPDTIAVCAGTARALLAVGRRLGLVSDLQRHISARMFGELARVLWPMTADTLADLGVPKARRDTIARGALIIASVLELLGKPVVYVAKSGIREGALVDLARRQRFSPRWLAAAQ